MAESSRRTQRRKDTPQRNPIPPRAVSEFARIHFPTLSLAKRLEDRFNGRKVVDSFYVDIEDFRTLIVCGRSVRNILQPWESAIDFDDRVYPNLVRVFYSNIEISATHLNGFLGISSDGHKIYTSRKALSFDGFCHDDGVRNICWREDLSYETCHLPFWSQLLPLQVRILHTMLQHIVTPRKGHSDEVTRLDVGLLDSLISGRPINLSYVIVMHMLRTPTVNHRLLPYGSIIAKILRHFEVPLLDAGYTKTRWIGPEAMTGIDFSRKNGKWIKTKNSKNRDTLIAPEDDRMLNDVYPPDQLPDFRLGAHPPPPRRRSVPQPPADSDSEEPPAQPSAPEPSVVPEQPSVSEPPPAPKQPPASVQPPASAALKQLADDVRRISERQQLIIDRLDTFYHDHQQLRSEFQTFKQQGIDQQLELIAEQCTLLRYFGYDSRSTTSLPS
ncbi:hypothetical protein KPL70_011874 [Citrus sinensis]|nr:hypothetical protein KPL70_011874 [Citrus sinensis]